MLFPVAESILPVGYVDRIGLTASSRLCCLCVVSLLHLIDSMLNLGSGEAAKEGTCDSGGLEPMTSAK